jgi:hypothetical protein
MGDEGTMAGYLPAKMCDVTHREACRVASRRKLEGGKGELKQGRVLITGFRVGDFIQPINVRKGAIERAHRLFIEFPTRVSGSLIGTWVNVKRPW